MESSRPKPELPLDGSDPSLAAFVRENHVAVRWVISRIIRNSHVADDLAQEAFAEFIGSVRAGKLAVMRSPRNWLLAIARNRAISHVRTNARQVAVIGEIAAETPAVSQAELPTSSDEDRALRQLSALRHCLGLLQPAHRQLVDEHYRQGKSSELIAAQLGKASGAVRMMMVRIRTALAKCVRKQLGAHS